MYSVSRIAFSSKERIDGDLAFFAASTRRAYCSCNFTSWKYSLFTPPACAADSSRLYVTTLKAASCQEPGLSGLVSVAALNSLCACAKSHLMSPSLRGFITLLTSSKVLCFRYWGNCFILEATIGSVASSLDNAAYRSAIATIRASDFDALT